MPNEIFQIFYNDQSLSFADKGFSLIDNSANQRPDWREYWPIREHLKQNPYFSGMRGYFSSKFRLKTNLTPSIVFSTIDSANCDVFSFSPFIDQSAFYRNIFEHGEHNHPGLINAVKLLCERMNIDFDLENLVGDHRYFIFSNFFVAKQSFWEKWLEIGEFLYSTAERNSCELGMILNSKTIYRDGIDVQLKVFIMERIASLVLHLHPKFTVKAFNPFNMPTFGSLVSKFPAEMAISNSLKFQFHETSETIYLNVYESIRKSVLLRISET